MSSGPNASTGPLGSGGGDAPPQAAAAVLAATPPAAAGAKRGRVSEGAGGAGGGGSSSASSSSSSREGGEGGGEEEGGGGASGRRGGAGGPSGVVGDSSSSAAASSSSFNARAGDPSAAIGGAAALAHTIQSADKLPELAPELSGGAASAAAAAAAPLSLTVGLPETSPEVIIIDAAGDNIFRKLADAIAPISRTVESGIYYVTRICYQILSDLLKLTVDVARRIPEKASAAASSLSAFASSAFSFGKNVSKKLYYAGTVAGNAAKVAFDNAMAGASAAGNIASRVTNAVAEFIRTYITNEDTFISTISAPARVILGNALINCYNGLLSLDFRSGISAVYSTLTAAMYQIYAGSSTVVYALLNIANRTAFYLFGIHDNPFPKILAGTPPELWPRIETRYSSNTFTELKKIVQSSTGANASQDLKLLTTFEAGANALGASYMKCAIASRAVDYEAAVEKVVATQASASGWAKKARVGVYTAEAKKSKYDIFNLAFLRTILQSAASENVYQSLYKIRASLEAKYSRLSKKVIKPEKFMGFRLLRWIASFCASGYNSNSGASVVSGFSLTGARGGGCTKLPSIKSSGITPHVWADWVGKANVIYLWLYNKKEKTPAEADLHDICDLFNFEQFSLTCNDRKNALLRLARFDLDHARDNDTEASELAELLEQIKGIEASELGPAAAAAGAGGGGGGGAAAAAASLTPHAEEAEEEEEESAPAAAAAATSSAPKRSTTSGGGGGITAGQEVDPYEKPEKDKNLAGGYRRKTRGRKQKKTRKYRKARRTTRVKRNRKSRSNRS